MQRLLFGVDREPGEVQTGKGKAQVNPCVVAFGPGPEGRTCGSCTHLFAMGGVAGRYLKCDLRRVTSGAATDHRSRWPACARYNRDIIDR